MKTKAFIPVVFILFCAAQNFAQAPDLQVYKPTFTNITDALLNSHSSGKVTSAGNDVGANLQVNYSNNPITNIEITAACIQDSTTAIFEIVNNNLFTLDIYYESGESFRGTINLEPGVVFQLYVYKNSMVNFYYNYQVFNTLLTNNILCGDPQQAYAKIHAYGLGYLNSIYLFSVENRNNFPVTVTGDAVNVVDAFTVPANGQVRIISDIGDLVLVCDGTTFSLPRVLDYGIEESAFISVTPISFDSTTATFYIQNNDGNPHDAILRNASGVEHRYTLAAYGDSAVVVENCNWDIYLAVPGLVNLSTQMIGDHFKVGSVSPANAALNVTPSVSLPTSVTASSMTLNGKITSNIVVSQQVPYHFAYGTDRTNLNLVTATQTATAVDVPGTVVSEELTGLTSGTTYYYQLVTDGGSSSVYSFLLGSPIPSSNLKLHLRSDAGVISSSSAVSEWNDLSGNGNNAVQSTSANQPTLVSNSMNGNPVIRFNGTNSKLTLPTSATLGIQSNPYEMFIVGKSSSSNVQFLIACGATEQFEYHLNGSSGARFIPITSTYIDEGTAGAFTDGNAHIFSARASATGGAVRVDGTDGGTSSGNILSSNSGALQLGVRSDGTYYLNGDIAEVILYNTNLSTSDRSTVEHYLADRYGITSSALPVELTSFSAECVDGKVLLNWRTTTEVNNYGFEIERAANLRGLQNGNGDSNPGSFSTIGFVQGKGNSNSPKSYSFTDKPTGGTEFKYRLKQIDFDGKYEYSGVTEVKIETPTQFSLAQNYPNPFNPETVISYELPVNGKVELRVYDLLGREVAELVNEEKVAGRYDVKFSVKDEGNNFSSGVYLYRLSANSFTAAKKFILIK